MLTNNFNNKNMTFILTMNFFSIVGLMIISLIYLIL